MIKVQHTIPIIQIYLPVIPDSSWSFLLFIEHPAPPRPPTNTTAIRHWLTTLSCCCHPHARPSRSTCSSARTHARHPVHSDSPTPPAPVLRQENAIDFDYPELATPTCWLPRGRPQRAGERAMTNLRGSSAFGQQGAASATAVPRADGGRGSRIGGPWALLAVLLALPACVRGFMPAQQQVRGDCVLGELYTAEHHNDSTVVVSCGVAVWVRWCH